MPITVKNITLKKKPRANEINVIKKINEIHYYYKSINIVNVSIVTKKEFYPGKESSVSVNVHCYIKRSCSD